MSLGRALNIGVNGLNAAALGASVSGHNATNAATPGYARQQLVQRGRPLHLGGGVEFDSPQRVVDQFADRRLNTALSFDGEATARADTLAVLDDVFADAEGGVGTALARFESALATFAGAPAESASRAALLGAAEHLAQSFNRAAGDLAYARDQANERIVHEVNVLNGQLAQIGSLNRQIRDGVGAGQDVATLMDTRDQLIRAVAERVPVTVLSEDGGSATVLLGGSRLLVEENGDAHTLTTTVDANGDRRVEKQRPASTEDVTGLLTSGRLAGLISARDGALTSAQTALSELAFDLTAAYNGVHAAGFGQDGMTGRNLFAPLASSSDAAAQMAVSADVAGQPSRLAAASAAGLSGDNRTALALAAVGESDVAASGTATPSEAYAQALAQASVAVQVAGSQAEHASLSRDQAQSLRDGISGVSTDEEMIQLTRYQRAYQASLRVIDTADAMLADLLSLR